MSYDWNTEQERVVDEIENYTEEDNEMRLVCVKTIPLDKLNNAIVFRNEDLRIGQAAFNTLANYEIEGIENCRASYWDPFHTVTTLVQWGEWARNHLLIHERDGIHYVIGVVKYV